MIISIEEELYNDNIYRGRTTMIISIEEELQ